MQCGEMHGMFPRVCGIRNSREHSAWVRRSVHGNGGCFNPRVVFMCLTPMSPDVLSGWVQKTMSSPEWAERVAMSWPWKRHLWSVEYDACGTLPEDCAQPSSVCELPVSAGPWLCRTWVYMGDGKVWNKQWVSNTIMVILIKVVSMVCNFVKEYFICN